MWVASELLRRGKRVGVDMEDWFSEDLLPPARASRPTRLLKRLERTLLTQGAFRTCPSNAMSEALAAAYQCAPPNVIYNAFPWSDRGKLDGEMRDRRGRSIPSIHWFSQTIGRGRGLEDLFLALPQLQFPAEIHLRGQTSIHTQTWIKASVSPDWHERIFVHPLANNDELLSRIAEHDIGFAGEMTSPPSRNLTVTNKLMQYLQGGLAVVASETSGQLEVKRNASGAIRLYRVGDASDLAAQLNFFLSSASEREAAKRVALKAASETFSWESQAPILLAAVEAALQ